MVVLSTRDVLDHVRHIETTVDGLGEIMTSVFEASNLLEQRRQGTTPVNLPRGRHSRRTNRYRWDLWHELR